MCLQHSVSYSALSSSASPLLQLYKSFIFSSYTICKYVLIVLQTQVTGLF